MKREKATGQKCISRKQTDKTHPLQIHATLLENRKKKEKRKII